MTVAIWKYTYVCGFTALHIHHWNTEPDTQTHNCKASSPFLNEKFYINTTHKKREREITKKRKKREKEKKTVEGKR